ncbi:MAG: FAD-binding domain-containing protein [Bacteroidota bacterium]
MNTLFPTETTPTFPTSYGEILQRLRRVDPVTYGRTRNFGNGTVTYLSPYISRGVISTRQVLEDVLEKGHSPERIEKFIQELAWRDYWQQVWIAKGQRIDSDLKNTQTPVTNHGISRAIIEGSTTIEAVDQHIDKLYETGYMHNHMRMYVAALACNMGRSHWLTPARWMYYHLLDGDWASNALSWQWVAGANSHKKYVANQDNINKYFASDQRDTFLDVGYEVLLKMPIPNELREITEPALETELPESDDFQLDPSRPTCIYNYYNMDPLWHKDGDVNRVLLLEPSHFRRYPISNNAMTFLLDLGENIPGLHVLVAEFSELIDRFQPKSVLYKEHPLNSHYRGQEEARDWMFDVTGYYSSFFQFWKRAKKQLPI